MQPAPLFLDIRLEDVHARLLTHYGATKPRELWDPLTQMIYSMLCSRTETPVPHAVSADLHQRFGTWERLRDPPIPEIEDTIRPVTPMRLPQPRLPRPLPNREDQNLA